MFIDDLKEKVKDLKKEGHSEDSIVIALKETIQHYILHYIFTNKKYRELVMYGGTVLRLGYKLPRMSEDLDFQTSNKINMDKLSEDLKEYFKNTYNFGIETTVKEKVDNETDVLFLKFDILREMNFKIIKWSKLQIRIDIHSFLATKDFIRDTIPIGRGTNLSYSINTYPLSTLMASKVVAFLKRDVRGINKVITNAKPRDVYDTMWYMGQGVVPDLEYLVKWGYEFKNFLDLKDALLIRINKIKDSMFREDLAKFFYNPNELEIWLSNWRVKFIDLLEGYQAFEVGNIKEILFFIEFATEARNIIFKFENLSKISRNLIFSIKLSDYWFEYADFRVESGNRVPDIMDCIKKTHIPLQELDYEYIGLFYNKIKDFIQRSEGVVFQESFETKSIRATGDKLDPNKHIYLNKRLLKKIQFEELL